MPRCKNNTGVINNFNHALLHLTSPVHTIAGPGFGTRKLMISLFKL